MTKFEFRNFNFIFFLTLKIKCVKKVPQIFETLPEVFLYKDQRCFCPVHPIEGRDSILHFQIFLNILSVFFSEKIFLGFLRKKCPFSYKSVLKGYCIIVYHLVNMILIWYYICLWRKKHEKPRQTQAMRKEIFKE